MARTPDNTLSRRDFLKLSALTLGALTLPEVLTGCGVHPETLASPSPLSSATGEPAATSIPTRTSAATGTEASTATEQQLSFPQSILEPLPNDPKLLTTITASQEVGVESYLRAHPWKFSENATPVVVVHTGPGDDDIVNVRCSNKPDGNVHTVAQYRLLNADGTTEGDYVWFWILGKDKNGNRVQNLNRGFIGEHAGEVHPIPGAKRDLEQLSLSFSEGHIYISYHNNVPDPRYYVHYESDSYVQYMDAWVNGVLPAELDGKTLVIMLMPGEQKP